MPFSLCPRTLVVRMCVRTFYREFFFLVDLLTATSPERHKLQGEAEDAGCDDGDGEGRDMSRGEYRGRRGLVLLLLLGWGRDIGGGTSGLSDKRWGFRGGDSGLSNRRQGFGCGDSGLSDRRLEDLAGRSPKEKWGWGRRRWVKGGGRRSGDTLVGRTSNRRERHRHCGWLWSAAVLFVGA